MWCVLLPEHVTVITVSVKNKVMLSLGVIVGYILVYAVFSTNIYIY